MGIKRMIAKAGGKAADKVAKLAVLAPEQLNEVQANREKYLSEMPDMTDAAAEELTSRLIAACSTEVFNSYLQQLEDYYVPVERDFEYESEFNPAYNIRYFNITKWVTDREENNIEKLVNVYEVLSNENCNIALIFDRKIDKTDVYLAVVNLNNDKDNNDADNYKQRLLEAIKGNFPGSECANEGRGVVPCLNNNNKYSVACATNIPAEKSEKFISQTIEKLLDGIVPDSTQKVYTIVLLATPVSDIENRKIHLAELYSGLAPYAGWETNFTYNESNATTASATFGVNVGASAGIQQGQNQSNTVSDSKSENTSQTKTDSNSSGETNTDGSSQADTEGTTDTTSDSTTEGFSKTDSSSTAEGHANGSSSNVTDGESFNKSATVGIGTPFGGPNASATVGDGKSHSVSWSENVSDSLTETISNSTTESASKTVGKALAKNVAKTVTSSTSKALSKTVGSSIANTLGKAVTNTVSATTGMYKGVNLGANVGANFARSSNVTATIGKNEGIVQHFTNYNIKHLLENLELQMKRLEESTALGMWDFAAYVLSEDQNVANNVAYSYIALTQGEKSYMTQSAVNLWRGDMGEHSDDAKEICGYIRELRHPVFALSPALTKEIPISNVYPAVVTPTASLSGKELAYSLNFPQKSISGLPVINCTQFGRDIVSYDLKKRTGSGVELGKMFHMNHVEKTDTILALDSLTSHTFITGSTGSGKSNTVYQLLSEVNEKGVKFLVVEPAKGEYKNVFGGFEDVSVYGTNPLMAPLLRINPFSFPKKIHVLEHMDRLIEIFNVCWPMYAAMPAVLKSAVEKTYKDCGWDLIRSCNKYGVDLYPTFADVAKNVKEIIDSSDYDSDNKGAYKGSLLTRLQSLSNGINGLIFSSDEIEDKKLFDENVIVDISRVGSTETKSLIMGMMVLKLQEYRMSSASGMNQKLKHVTVLEEAHNILRRTSTEQSQEGSNLIGKSVEMISNAIAEMRTYGEGFIIADQAPGLMDMSVIRNTNTKIIMRLPDQTDRELVGKAAGLNEEQIIELSKLQCGVAAVYQNEWVLPVLCKVNKYDVPEKSYDYNPENEDIFSQYDETLPESLLDCIMNKELRSDGKKEDIRELKAAVIKSNLSSSVKRDFVEYITKDGKDALESLRALVYEFLSAQDAIMSAKQCGDISEWVKIVVKGLNPSISKYTNQQIDLAMALILYEQSERDASYNDIFCKFTEVYQAKGGVY